MGQIAANGRTWAGNATKGVQGFHETEHADPGMLNLGPSPHSEDMEGSDFEWARIESLIGTRMRLDPERTVNPPKINTADNIAQTTRKMMNYVAKTSDWSDMTDADIAHMVGLEPGSEPMEEHLRRSFNLTSDDRIVSAVDTNGRPVYLSVNSAFTRTGSFRGGFSIANVAQRLVVHEFGEQFADEHPEFDKADIDAVMRRIEDKSLSGKGYAYMWDEQRFSPEVSLALVAAGGPEVANRLDTISAEEAQQLLNRLPRAEGLRAANGVVDKPQVYLVPYLDNAGNPIPGMTRNLYPDTAAAELAGATDRAKRATLNRAYRAFLEEQIAVEYDYGLQRGYVKRAAASHSATVFEQKKNVPQSHLDAAEYGFFKASGDFRHVEVDADTDLERLAHVEAEYSHLRKHLPQTDKAPALRWRKTGRHNAKGVYHVGVGGTGNIAVDPRHPDSFVHELAHHIDHTAGGKNISSSDEFRPILRAVQKALSESDDPLVRRKFEYACTPTEVLARSGEAYFHWKGVQTSLNGDAEKYSSGMYTTLEPVRGQIVAFWDAKLSELGAEVPG